MGSVRGAGRRDAGGDPGRLAAAAPKYYFQLQPVKAGPEVDADLKSYTGEALKAELASRPEWASDIGPAGQAAPGTDRTALVAELKKRNLRGFDVTARIEKLKQEVKDPKPGARNKQLAVEVQLTVFGTTIPDAKLAFSGDGQSGERGRGLRAAPGRRHRRHDQGRHQGRHQAGGRSGRVEALHREGRPDEREAQEEEIGARQTGRRSPFSVGRRFARFEVPDRCSSSRLHCSLRSLPWR